MTVDAVVERGWSEHAEQPEAVFARVREAAALATEARHLVMLGGLADHIAGEHLFDHAGGVAVLEAFAAHPLADDAVRRSLSRAVASQWMAAGDGAAADAALAAGQEPGAPPGQALARVSASAAAKLAAARRFPEASDALERALAAAAYGPGREDPAARALAIAANNLACGLEERVDRGADGTALMKRAAAVTRAWWAVAGDWSNVSLAEYRLAMTHLRAGEPDVALGHARAALALCEAHAPTDADARFLPLLAMAEAGGSWDEAEAIAAGNGGWMATELEAARHRAGPRRAD